MIGGGDDVVSDVQRAAHSRAHRRGRGWPGRSVVHAVLDGLSASAATGSAAGHGRAPGPPVTDAADPRPWYWRLLERVGLGGLGWRLAESRPARWWARVTLDVEAYVDARVEADRLLRPPAPCDHRNMVSLAEHLRVVGQLEHARNELVAWQARDVLGQALTWRPAATPSDPAQVAP